MCGDEDEDEDGRGDKDGARDAGCCCWWVTVAKTTVTMAPDHRATVAIKRIVVTTEHRLKGRKRHDWAGLERSQWINRKTQKMF